MPLFLAFVGDGGGGGGGKEGFSTTYMCMPNAVRGLDHVFLEELSTSMCGHSWIAETGGGSDEDRGAGGVAWQVAIFRDGGADVIYCLKCIASRLPAGWISVAS